MCAATGSIFVNVYRGVSRHGVIRRDQAFEVAAGESTASTAAAIAEATTT